MTRTLLGLLFAQSGKSQFDGVVNYRALARWFGSQSVTTVWDWWIFLTPS